LFKANVLVKVVAILGVVKPCTCSYARTLEFLIPCSYTRDFGSPQLLLTFGYAYLDSLSKFEFRA